MQPKRISQSPVIDIQVLQDRVKDLLETLETLTNVEKMLAESSTAIGSRILQFIQAFASVHSQVESLVRLELQEIPFRSKDHLEPLLLQFEAVRLAQRRVESPAFKADIESLLPDRTWSGVLKKVILGFLRSIPRPPLLEDGSQQSLELESRELTRLVDVTTQVESQRVSPFVEQMKEMRSQDIERARSKSFSCADEQTDAQMESRQRSYSALELKRRTISEEYRHDRYDNFSSLEQGWLAAFSKNMSSGNPGELHFLSTIRDAAFRQTEDIHLSGISMRLMRLPTHSEQWREPLVLHMVQLLSSADYLCHVATTEVMALQFLNCLKDEHKRVLYTPTKEVAWWIRLQILLRPRSS